MKRFTEDDSSSSECEDENPMQYAIMFKNSEPVGILQVRGWIIIINCNKMFVVAWKNCIIEKRDAVKYKSGKNII